MTEQRSATLELPWPDRRLSPNARVHWTKMHLAKNCARIATSWICVAQNVPRNIPALRVVASYVFLPPDKRQRDLDNVIASMKAAQDGIAIHIGIDDSKWVCAYEFGEPVKGGKVIVNLRWPAP